MPKFDAKSKSLGMTVLSLPRFVVESSSYTAMAVFFFRKFLAVGMIRLLSVEPLCWNASWMVLNMPLDFLGLAPPFKESSRSKNVVFFFNTGD